MTNEFPQESEKCTAVNNTPTLRRSAEEQRAAEELEYQAGFERARTSDDPDSIYAQASDCEDLAFGIDYDACRGRAPVERRDDASLLAAYWKGLMDGLWQNPTFDPTILDNRRDLDSYDLIEQARYSRDLLSKIQR